MRFPADLKYTTDHEWARLEGNRVTVGITDHAQSALGDVVFVELPAVGRMLRKGESFGVVESIKAVSDLYSPVNGQVLEVNSALTDDPARVNRDPHGQAWLVRIALASPGPDLRDLMDAPAYEKYVATLK